MACTSKYEKDRTECSSVQCVWTCSGVERLKLEDNVDSLFTADCDKCRWWQIWRRNGCDGRVWNVRMMPIIVYISAPNDFVFKKNQWNGENIDFWQNKIAHFKLDINGFFIFIYCESVQTCELFACHCWLRGNWLVKCLCFVSKVFTMELLCKLTFHNIISPWFVR